MHTCLGEKASYELTVCARTTKAGEKSRKVRCELQHRVVRNSQNNQKYTKSLMAETLVGYFYTVKLTNRRTKL